MPINCALQANKNLLHTFEGAFSSPFQRIYLFTSCFMANFSLPLITILTCQTSREREGERKGKREGDRERENRPPKWQDIIQLNSFTCIKLRDNKSALNPEKKKRKCRRGTKGKGRKRSKKRTHTHTHMQIEQWQEESSQIKWNTKRISVYMFYIHTIWEIYVHISLR